MGGGHDFRGHGFSSPVHRRNTLMFTYHWQTTIFCFSTKNVRHHILTLCCHLMFKPYQSRFIASTGWYVFFSMTRIYLKTMFRALCIGLFLAFTSVIYRLLIVPVLLKIVLLRQMTRITGSIHCFHQNETFLMCNLSFNLNNFHSWKPHNLRFQLI